MCKHGHPAPAAAARSQCLPEILVLMVKIISRAQLVERFQARQWVVDGGQSDLVFDSALEAFLKFPSKTHPIITRAYNH